MYSNSWTRILLLTGFAVFSLNSAFSQESPAIQQAKNYVAKAYLKELGGSIDRSWYLNNLTGKLLDKYKKATATEKLTNECMNSDPLINAQDIPQTYRIGNISILSSGDLKVAVGLNWPTEAMSSVYLRLKKSGNSFKIKEISYVNSNNDGRLSQQLGQCIQKNPAK